MNGNVLKWLQSEKNSIIKGYYFYPFSSMVIVKAQVTFGETIKAVEAQTTLSTDLHSDINRKLPTGRKTFFCFTAVAWDERSHTYEGVWCPHRSNRRQTRHEKMTRRVFVFWKTAIVPSSCQQLKGFFLQQPQIKTFLSLCCLFLEEDQSSGAVAPASLGFVGGF